MKLLKRIFSSFLATALVFSVFSYELGTVQALNATTNATINYTINYYLQGTTSSLTTSVTGSGDDGSYITAEAPTIPGYLLTPFDASPVRIQLSATNNTINFYYIANIYTLTFDSRGGSTVNSVTQGYNTSIIQPTNPVRTYYTFTGWYTEAECINKVTWPYKMPLNGGTLYAGWTQTQYTLTFKTNSSTYTIQPVKAVAGTLIQKPSPDPTKSGFRFDGWCSDSGLKQPIDWPYKMQSNDVTIYGKWTLIRYTISFNSNGGTDVPSITDSTLPPNPVSPPDPPLREGYTFAGWYYDNGTFQNPVDWETLTMPATGFTLYAKWSPNQITITFDSNGGSAVNPLTADAGSTITAPVPPKKFGFSFAGWVLNDETHVNVPFTFSKMPTVNFTLYATWVSADKALKVDLQPCKTVNGVVVQTNKARVGDIVTVRVVPRTNFYCGSTNFVIMYDPSFYTIVGTNNDAITPNLKNRYFDQSVSSYRGYTASPTYQWPSTFTDGESSRYKFVTASFAATGKSKNCGLPNMFDGNDWLFSINLRVNADATGSGKVFMDTRWDRTSTNTTGMEYYYYCSSGLVLSSSGSSTIDYDTDYSGANHDVALDTSVAVTSRLFFNSDGGSDVPVFTGEVGMPVAPPTPPTKEGYTFSYWSPSFPDIMPANDTTLVAVWKANSYDALFYADDAHTQLLATVPTNFGEQIVAPDPLIAPAVTGYTATGWTPTPGIMEAHDMSFTVVYTVNTYNANFYVDGELYATVPTKYGETIIPPAPPTKEGWTFTGWAPTLGKMPAGDKSFNANFTINQYTITFDSQGGSYIAPIKKNFGQSVNTKPQPSRDYYTFVDWFYESECVTPVVWPYKIVAKNVTFYAKWERVPVSFGLNEGLALILDPDKHIIYGFEEGTLTESTSPSDIFTVTGDARLEILPTAIGYGTGTQILLTDNVTNEVVDTYTVVIFGDVDGDGFVTSTDESLINLVASYQSTFGDGTAAAYAADVNHDGIIDTFDVNIVRAKNYGIAYIDQTNGGQLF